MTKNHYKKYKKNSNILLTCEHASNRIPRKFKNLGLSRKDLKFSKDFYDSGSFELMKKINQKIDCSYIYANVSRLVIDYNRRLDAVNKYKNSFHSCPLKRDVLVERNGKDELINIPTNTFKNKKDFLQEELKRYKEYATPYIKDGYMLIDRMRNIHKKSYVIMIHSFFPQYNGKTRSVDIGVLYGTSQIARETIKSLKDNSSFVIGDNKPWRLQDADGSVFYKVEDMKDVELIVFDVNNKHLQTQKEINQMAHLIVDALQESGVLTK